MLKFLKDITFSHRIIFLPRSNAKKSAFVAFSLKVLSFDPGKDLAFFSPYGKIYGEVLQCFHGNKGQKGLAAHLLRTVQHTYIKSIEE
jgi:hypothetical protein